MHRRARSRRELLATAGGITALGLSGCVDGGASTTDDGESGDGDDGGSGGGDEGEPGDGDEPTAPDEVTAEGDWPVALYDSQSTGAALDRSGPREPVSELWSHGFDELPSRPICNDGRLYVEDQGGHCVALDATSGDVLWEEDVSGSELETSFSLAATDDAVFVQGDGLYALDPESGDELWEQPDAVVSDMMVVDDGVLYVGEGRGVRALEADSGDELWYGSTGNRVYTLAVDGGRVFTSGPGGTNVAFDASTGDHLWEDVYGGWNLSALVATDGDVIVADAENNRTVRYDGATGDVVWEAEQDARYSPALTDDTLYTPAASGVGLGALDPESGDPRSGWSSTRSIAGHPVATSDTVYAPTGSATNPDLRAFDAESGEVRWVHELDGTVGQLTVTEDVLFAVHGVGNRIVALA